MQPPRNPLQTWDIFCRVIDNYGDVGVCWRLARQLADAHGKRVRLWVDDLATLQVLCPELAVTASRQSLAGIEICRWTENFAVTETADVVIEAFACELPESYLHAMTARAAPPRWINLEYLSAEPWVAGCHGLASPHPSLPLTKYFFFPGFSAATGGLLREDAVMAAEIPASPPTINLFCYAHAPLPALLAALSASPQPWRLNVSPGQPVAALEAAYLLPPVRGSEDGVSQGVVPRRPSGLGELASGTTAACPPTHPPPGLPLEGGGDESKLRIALLPFLAPDAYDALLGQGTLNIVRGEDSFVRAQLAGRPFLWHVYPQAEDAHLTKLHAFLDCYTAGLAPALAQTIRALFLAWNTPVDTTHFAACWQRFEAALPEIAEHARQWQRHCRQLPELSAALVDFCAHKA